MMHQKKVQWCLSVKNFRTPYCRSALHCTLSEARCCRDEDASIMGIYVPSGQTKWV